MGRQKEGSFRLHTILLEHDAELRWGGGGFASKKLLNLLNFIQEPTGKPQKLFLNKFPCLESGSELEIKYNPVLDT